MDIMLSSVTNNVTILAETCYHQCITSIKICYCGVTIVLKMCYQRI
jgi:hypothetical protein